VEAGPPRGVTAVPLKFVCGCCGMEIVPAISGPAHERICLNDRRRVADDERQRERRAAQELADAVAAMKPCPFCGGRGGGLFLEKYDPHPEPEVGMGFLRKWRGGCREKNCGAVLGGAYDIAEFLRKWNRRDGDI
jgi:hypothetical protein